MRPINVLLSFGVSLLLGLLVFEGGLRLLGKGPREKLVQFDPVLGWSKRENFEYKNKGPEFDVEIRTNEHGLNDDPMPDPGKPEDVTCRVLVLGDSFAQGFSVSRDQLFVDHLERWWRAEGRPVDVVNAGTQAYDTAQEVAWLLEHGAKFQPDVILLFPYYNDLYWNSRTGYAGAEGERGKPRFAGDGSLERHAIEPPPEKGFLGNTATGRLITSRRAAPSPEHQFSPAGTETTITKELAPFLTTEPPFMAKIREHTRGALEALKAEAERLGARAAVVPIPPRVVFDPTYRDTWTANYFGGQSGTWNPERPVDLVVELAGEVGLDVIDTRKYLQGRADAGEPLYFKFDWHFNPTGNDAFATVLRSELDERGLVPAAAQIVPALPAPPAGMPGVPGWLKVYGVLLIALTALYWANYRDEPMWQPPLKIATLLAAVFSIIFSVVWLQGALPYRIAQLLGPLLATVIIGFIAWKLGRRLGTIAELLKAFALRGHWYLMPLVVVLLTVGSLLVVAASSPLVAPFIYTLF